MTEIELTSAQGHEIQEIVAKILYKLVENDERREKIERAYRDSPSPKFLRPDDRKKIRIFMKVLNRILQKQKQIERKKIRTNQKMLLKGQINKYNLPMKISKLLKQNKKNLRSQRTR